jgi:hypothetical protein
MKRPPRDPGPTIKQVLRREVNFGCPVRSSDGTGCGSPILTYHHFDPPWAGHFVHDPEGMIALCPQHHAQADGGLWTHAQLRAFKHQPYVDDAIRVQWPWQPESIVMIVGPSVVVGSGSPMRLSSRPVMHFKPVTIPQLGVRTVQFDSEIRDEVGRPWLRISESWFDLRLAGTTDLLFTAQTKTFLARHSDTTYLSMGFIKMSAEEFQNWLLTFMSNPEIARSAAQSAINAGTVDSEGNISVVKFEGHLRSRYVEVKVKDGKMFFKSFVTGLEEQFEWHSRVVDSARRAILRIDNGPEFFSLG